MSSVVQLCIVKIKYSVYKNVGKSLLWENYPCHICNQTEGEKQLQCMLISKYAQFMQGNT